MLIPSDDDLPPFDDDLPDDEPDDPLVTEQIDLALAPYRRLLPEEVLKDFGYVLSMALESHPVAIGLMARLNPALVVEVDMSQDPEERRRNGFTSAVIWRALMEALRDYGHRTGRDEYLSPDASMRALFAFLSYLPYDEDVWQLSMQEVRAATGILCDSIVGAVFLGLTQELRTRPACVEEWGETGQALSKTLPRLLAVLHKAFDDMPPKERVFLRTYQACGWDAERLAKTFYMERGDVETRCHDAMLELGMALRATLEAERDAPEPPG